MKCKKCAYKIQVWVIISITHLYEGRTYSTLQTRTQYAMLQKKGTIYCNMEIDFLKEITVLNFLRKAVDGLGTI